MPDVIACPSCGAEVSRRALLCRVCGGVVSDPPKAITPSLLAGLLDQDLSDVLFRYTYELLNRNGCYDGPISREKEFLPTLPVGLRAHYALVTLESEVLNGGLSQWFTNSSGSWVELPLEALQLIGATKHAELIGQAITINRELEEQHPRYAKRFVPTENRYSPLGVAFIRAFDSLYAPKFDQLTTAFCSLEETDSMWNYFMRYVRENPSDFCHDSTSVA